MANRKSFLAALWNGDIVGAVSALVAGIMHMIVMGLFLLLLGLTAPILAVVMPFYAYYCTNGMFTFAYFFLGGFASAMFTNIVYCRVTFTERKARGETFGQHCRTVAGWPTLSILCSWAADIVFCIMFRDMLLSDSNMAHFIFFALAPIAVFMPTWIYLIHRRRQKAAMEELRRRFEERCRRRDAEFLRSQGIAS